MYKLTINIFVGFIVIILHSFSYPRDIPVTVRCKPTVGEASWNKILGEPEEQYSLTSIGLEINAEDWDSKDMITRWMDWDKAIFHGNHHGLRGAIAHVGAKCVLSSLGPEIQYGPEMTMFDYDDLSSPPVLTCKKGEGVAIRFYSPNSEDPNKFIYHATLTVTRFDDPGQEQQNGIKVQNNVKAAEQNGNINGNNRDGSIDGFSSSTESNTISRPASKPKKTGNCIIQTIPITLSPAGKIELSDVGKKGMEAELLWSNVDTCAAMSR